MSAQPRQSFPAPPWVARSRLDRERAPAEMADGFSVRVRGGSASTVVTPVGELDLAVVEEFDHVLWAAQTQARSVVIDLRALEFIDCAGVRSLIGAQLRASNWRRHFEVICADGQIRRLLAVTGVDQLLSVITPIAPSAFSPRTALVATRQW